MFVRMGVFETFAPFEPVLRELVFVSWSGGTSAYERQTRYVRFK